MEIKTRSIRVFDTNCEVKISCGRELKKLSPDNGKSFFNDECQRIDEEIAYYVSDEEFDNLPDDEFEEMVNRDCYDWSGLDEVVFQFSTDNYSREDVEGLSRQACEHLCNVDGENVTKFDIQYSSIQDLLNDDVLDTGNCYFRVFI